nr:hypothetical protein BaRGS_019480 [Batillaria attramentaria]
MAVNDSKGMDRNAKLVANSLTKLARSANIFDDAEAETIEELIADYFLVDGEEESPAVDDESAELPSGPRGACNAEFSSESEADEPANISDSDDEPLVQNCQEQPDMLQPDHELGRVKTFKCKCKAEEKKKAPLTTLEQAIPGSPCLSQFSVDEVMARRLNMAEFNEAEKDMIILGALAEAIPQQVNYLIDEGMCSSKGSNMVISLLHHFLENYGLGEMSMDVHCDNCSGQNKNKYVLWYMAWRTLRALHSEITVNFMPAGHTKFAPDWCFGLLKRRFRLSEVHCLQDLCNVVETSTKRRINRPQLVGTETGEVLVKVYDWQTYFQGWCRPVKGVKEYFHFKVQSERPGVVFLKKELNGPEEEFLMVTDATTAQQRLAHMPAEIPPPGLPEARRQYLRQHIRPFVRPGVQDRLCP